MNIVYGVFREESLPYHKIFFDRFEYKNNLFALLDELEGEIYERGSRSFTYFDACIFRFDPRQIDIECDGLKSITFTSTIKREAFLKLTVRELTEEQAIGLYLSDFPTVDSTYAKLAAENMFL